MWLGAPHKERKAYVFAQQPSSPWSSPSSSQGRWLATIKDKSRVETDEGTLLLDEKFKGRVFVKGVFVKKDPNMLFGYDLPKAQVDRDRKMLDEYDLKYRTQNVWAEAMKMRPDLIGNFIGALETQAADVAGVTQFTAPYLPDEAKRAAKEQFEKRYGEGALPVATLSQSAEVEHLGRRGIVCHDSLRVVLEQTIGTVEENKRKLANEVIRRYGWHELTQSERQAVTEAISLVSSAEPGTEVTLDLVDVVDFRDPVIHGMHDNGRLQLAHEVLASRADTLRVLVHETAHRVGGGDGEKSHVANVERIWSNIVERMRA